MNEVALPDRPCILVVDDNEINLQVVAAILTDQIDCELMYVTNGEEALQAVQKWHPLLILLDIMMPGMNGYEVCEHLKQDPQTAEIPVIFITAKTEERDLVTGFSVGAVDYITKPFRPEELLARVRTHLQGALASRQLRKLADDIRQSEIWFKALFREAPISILVHDCETGAIVNANPHAYQAYGLSSLAELQAGSFWADPPYSAQDALDLIHKTVREGPQQIEWMSRTQTGEIFWEKMCLRMISLQGIERVLVVGIDITDRKLLEEERTQMQMKLMQTGRLEAVGQLAAGVAHEINNPVQFIGDNTTFVRDALRELLECVDQIQTACRDKKDAVDGAPEDLCVRITEALERMDLDFVREEIPNALEQTAEGVKRIRHIVRAMREFSHPDSEEKVWVDVNACVQSSVTMTRSIWKSLAELSMALADELPSVHGYAGAINQVLSNLIINAAQAIEEKQDQALNRIVIRTFSEGSHVVIHIQDTGPGIPPEIQSQVFNPFFTTKEVGKGTGQGLTIVRNLIVKGHGGEIDFETEPGQGTTFKIRLPAR